MQYDENDLSQNVQSQDEQSENLKYLYGIDC